MKRLLPMQFHYKYSGRAFSGAPQETWPDAGLLHRQTGGTRLPTQPVPRAQPPRWDERMTDLPSPTAAGAGPAQGVLFLRQGKQDSSRRGQLMCQRKPTTTTPSLALLFLFLALPTERHSVPHHRSRLEKYPLEWQFCLFIRKEIDSFEWQILAR